MMALLSLKGGYTQFKTHPNVSGIDETEGPLAQPVDIIPPLQLFDRIAARSNRVFLQLGYAHAEGMLQVAWQFDESQIV